MEYYWTLLNNSNASSTVSGHNRNFNPNHAWDSSDLPTAAAAAASRPDWTYYTPSAAPPMQHNHNNSSSSLYRNPDSHLTCLKLGKRHYFEDLSPPPPPPLFGPLSAAKKGKSCQAGPESGAPRCQVEGCEAVLLNAKDYHRRHKVCEMHAKAAKVVVLGIEQRFCQQCSRFHAVAEFDESKRSCRRRLAGHNQRRRKTSQQLNNVATKHHYHGGNNGECALSLLSPTNYTPWSAADLSARCSAALRELIAENRASVMASPHPNQNRGHVTLNLMQGPGSAFGIMSGHKDNDGDCSELWNLPLGY